MKTERDLVLGTFPNEFGDLPRISDLVRVCWNVGAFS